MSNKAGITKALDLVPGRCWSRAAAWLWITGLADGQGRAEVSSRKLAAQFGWTRAKTRRFLDRLTDCGLIQRENRQTGPSSSVATICFGKDFP
ncbi:helix-turn-helix domain-containing protein, partial [Tabrizicola sp.]|uniref:helix-turn-helix domain-containing protein n=1 Tax=Tabrizicola sp. TaxID=2005166 RepID=UPI002FDDDBC0